MSDDEIKRRARAAVLSRRAKFVAAALASVACGKTSGEGPPYACLKVSPIPVDAGAPSEDAGAVEDAGATQQAPPMPCLEIAYPPPPAKRDAGASKNSATDAGPRSKPQVCLSDPFQ